MTTSLQLTLTFKKSLWNTPSEYKDLSNYKEMYDYYRLIESYFKKRKTPVKWEVKTNRIINWGTYTDEEMMKKEVFKPEHPLFNDFLLELDKIKDLPNIVHNFHELYETESTLI